jgi:hypothetical protein
MLQVEHYDSALPLYINKLKTFFDKNILLICISLANWGGGEVKRKDGLPMNNSNWDAPSCHRLKT